MNINKMPNNIISDEYKKFLYPQVEWWECIFADLDIRNLTKEELAQYEISRANASMYNAYQKSMEEKEITIKQKDAEIEQHKTEIKQHKTEIKQKDAEIEQKDAEIEQKDAEIERNYTSIKNLVIDMLRKGFSTKEEIAKMTNMSMEQIEEIEKEQ